MIFAHQKSFSTRSLCAALGEPRASWYRFLKPHPMTSNIPRSPRRLTDTEELMILNTLNTERFQDMAPGEAYATLLDEGVYLCSERTMYRILSRYCQNVIRRQSAPRVYAKPELLTTCPNELWSWDITKLKGPAKWTYYYLYKILDVYSRYVVGWMLAYRESAALAQDLIAETCLKQKIIPGSLTVHADNSIISFSPSIQPFSEAAFKTLKYRPGYPERFGSIEDARLFCKEFFTWYNSEHRHSGIAMVTPENVHYNNHQKILTDRSLTLEQAYQVHPERFVKGVSTVQQVPNEVWINKPNTLKKIVHGVS